MKIISVFVVWVFAILSSTPLWGQQSGSIIVETDTGENPDAIAAILEFETDGAEGIKISDCNPDASGTLIIPEKINSYTVTRVAASAFRDCTQLEYVSLPSTITQLSPSSFRNCTGLIDITLSDNIKDIQGSAFKDCSALLSVKIPSSIERILGSAFRDCSSLTTVQFPNKDFTIGPEAFYQAGLTSLIIPNDQIYIGHSAFRLCPINEIEVPDTYTASLAYIGIRPEVAHSKLMETVASSEAVASNTAEIAAIKDQLAILVDALAQKDAEIEQKNELIAQQQGEITQIENESITGIFRRVLDDRDAEISELKKRPTQREFDAVVAERDKRLTLEEVQDARTGSVMLTQDSEGNVQVQLEIEESSDLEVWSNEGKKLKAEFELAEGKKFLRFALTAGN